MPGLLDHHLRVALVGQRAGHVDDPAGHVDEVDVLGLEHGGAGVEAADLQQVGQQRLEAVELELEQLGGPRGDRVEAGPGVVEDVAGHPHRREGCPQLVGDVGDEAALEPAQLLELADLALEVGGHLVERRREARQVVLAAHPQPLLELARGQPLGDPTGHPDRGDHLAGDQPGQAGDEQQQQDPGREERPGDERHRLALLVERVEVVERVGVVVGRQRHLAAHHDAGPVGQAGDGPGGRDVGVGPGRRGGLVEVLLEGLGDAGGVEALGELRAAVGEPAAGADRRGQDHREATGRAAGDERLDHVLPLAGLVDVGARRGGQLLARLRRLVLHLGDHLVDAVVQQALAGLLDEDPAHDAHHERGEQHGGRDHARLHRATPEGQRAAQGVRHTVDRVLQPRGRGEGGHGRRPIRPTPCRPCSPRRGRSPRSRGSPGRARPWSAAAARGR